jgi:MEMO1 family protein
MLQYFLDYTFSVVPVTFLKQTPQNASFLAKSIMERNKSLKKRICILASSDFSHFVDAEEGKKADQYVLDEILNLNSEGVFREVRKRDISVCGYGPIMTLIEYALLLSENLR